MTNNTPKNQHKGNHRRVKTELEYEFYNKKSKVYNT